MIFTKKDYDVIDTPSSSINDVSDCVKLVHEMSSKSPKIYRDENGALISQSRIAWDVADNKIKQGDLSFGRSVELAYQYKDAMTAIKRDWISIDDYCKHKFLCYPSQTKTIDGKELFFVHSSATPGVETALCKNDFPYYLKKGIEHMTLWTIRSDLNPSEYVDSLYPTNKFQVIIFENLNVNKSVKSVLHYHVLIKERQSGFISSQIEANL